MTTPADYRAALADVIKLLDESWDENDLRVRTQDAVTMLHALLAAPEAVGVPTDWDIVELWAEAAGMDTSGFDTQHHAFAHLLLSRYGTAHPAPVPVGERLPGEPDLDDDGKCWLGEKGTSCDPTAWAYVYLAQVIDAASWPSGREWLPHWALPLPGDQQESEYPADTTIPDSL